MGIIVKNVSKEFKTGNGKGGIFTAVDNVSFHVAQGHLVALLGPSGSGKSTVLRIIAGLEKPDTGEVVLEGKSMTTRPAKERGVGFVFQHYALFKHMTVWKNIALGLEVNKFPPDQIKSRVNELLELVQLKGYDHRYPSQLSGGQRQRVALARALAPRPNFLLLDEPFGALDAKVRRNLSVQLRKLHNEVKTTSVFVTHDQEEAFELADEIVVINHGRVEQIGSAEDIYDQPASKFVASFIGNINVLEGCSDGQTIRIGKELLPIPGASATNKTGDVVILIRPENIRISKDSEKNLIATVKTVSYRGDRYEIMLDLAGLELRMIYDKTRGETQRWVHGSKLPIQLTKFTLFEAHEGHEALRAKLQSLGYIE
ncbi:ABC transporter ATP-binding protein [bacterium]|nr:ABC transporter ATP-binding protein [candidate division CSSED10-310 bacterium]